MANHARILRGRVDLQEVRALALRFCQEQLKGLFHLEEGKQGWMCLRYQDDPYIEVEFWLDTTKDTWGPEGGEPLKKYEVSEDAWESAPEVPCVEVRHGHYSRFEWWVDFAWEQFLATQTGGMITDDGIGEMWAPKNQWSTFREYMDYNRKEHIRCLGAVRGRAVDVCERWALREWFKRYPQIKKAFW